MTMLYLSSAANVLLGFVRDQFTTLPETSDRAFCTKVYAKYEFDGDTYGVDFNGTW